MGLAVGNLRAFDVPAKRPFFETLVQLIIGVLFVAISATVTPESLQHLVLPTERLPTRDVELVLPDWPCPPFLSCRVGVTAGASLTGVTSSFIRVGSGELGVEPALGRAGGGSSSSVTAKHVGNHDRERGSGQWSADVDPVVAEVRADEVWSEGACGIHRRARNRASPQSRECNVTTDTECADHADVLRAGGGAQDDADQSQGEDELHPERSA
jgi:hypothetical protein